MANLKKLYVLFHKGDRKKLAIIFIMMIFAAIFETCGIGLIVPFVSVVTEPELIEDQAILHGIYQFFHFSSTNAFIIFSVIALLLVFILKNVYLLIFNHIQFKIIFKQQVDMSRDLFATYLKKPYTFHLLRHSSNLLRNVNQEVEKVFQGIVLSGFQLLTEYLVVLCIFGLLLFMAPIATLTSCLVLGSSVSVFFIFLRRKIGYLGKEEQYEYGKMIKWVNQGLGASKEVKVAHKEDFFIKSYFKHSNIRAGNRKFMKMLEVSPRLFIESILVFIVLMTVLIITFKGTSTSNFVATMALFTMAAFRLMPSMTRVVDLATKFRYSKPALDVIYDDLVNDRDQFTRGVPSNIKQTTKKDLSLKGEISLHSLTFKYPTSDVYSLKNISLTIPKGKSVAIVGESGAGKTTLMDMILGLFEPDVGKILVDGVDISHGYENWQRQIGYIPQFIFLYDDTIRGNIAFGVDKEDICDADVWSALEKAQLKEVVEKLPDQLDTVIGENGMRFSGGQRQRIGIARALFHNPSVICMDEATSALDNDTENTIMSAIDSFRGEKTVIMIAHRKSSIRHCDMVFEIKDGRLMTYKKQNLKA